MWDGSLPQKLRWFKKASHWNNSSKLNPSSTMNGAGMWDVRRLLHHRRSAALLALLFPVLVLLIIKRSPKSLATAVSFVFTRNKSLQSLFSSKNVRCPANERSNLASYTRAVRVSSAVRPIRYRSPPVAPDGSTNRSSFLRLSPSIHQYPSLLSTWSFVSVSLSEKGWCRALRS